MASQSWPFHARPLSCSVNQSSARTISSILLVSISMIRTLHLRSGWVRPGRLAERDPEPIAVANDEFAHAVKRVVQVFDDLRFAVEAPAECVHVIDVRVE